MATFSRQSCEIIARAETFHGVREESSASAVTQGELGELRYIQGGVGNTTAPAVFVMGASYSCT